MARNYANGHSWDHLDGKVVTKAADEIESLTELVQQRTFDLLTCGNERKALRDELVNAQRVIKILQGR